tara:strand:- start:2100 stop:3677 length:1578 start_codon:yes stop_codon:yes gene_type:complete
MNIIDKKKEIFLILGLFLSSIFFNQYYGNIGIQPIDSFFPFNAGYDVLNGHFPFRDYWTITGPFMDVIQAFFFKVFGVSWFSYVLHASIFNFIFTIFFFYTLKKFELNINYCFLYSLFLSLLAYPSAGTPYVDHQSSYSSVMAVFCFILALKTNSRLWWFILPIIFGISFLTKQTPTAYIFLIISFLSLVHFIFNFDIKKIIIGFLGSILILGIFFAFIFLGDIPLESFINQYILFPLSVGEHRLADGIFYPLEFERIISRFKLIHISAIILFIVAIKNLVGNYRYLIDDEFLIIFSLIGLIFSLIAHQLMSINGIYIYFLIPILIGFSHIYSQKYFKDKIYIIYLLIFISASSTIYYGYKYINKRNFMDLTNANISKALDSKYIHKKLSGLKWITPQQPDNPKDEMNKLKQVLKIIENDNSNKIIITDYQFISVILSLYDNSPNKVWYYRHVHPSKKNKYFDVYKKFFINKIKNKKIQTIYIVKPMFGVSDALEFVLDSDCINRIEVNENLEKNLIKNCDQIFK